MKYTRLKSLKQSGINIPDFFLYEDSLEKIKDFKNKEIILRSSYKLEDTKKNSFAGVFYSIGKIDKDDKKEIQKNIELIKNDANKKIKHIGGKREDFQIIIQEYISSDLGGVIFVEGDKILIEINSGAGAEKVVNGDIKQSVYIYKNFNLSSGEKLLDEKLIKDILENIEKIKKIYNFDLDIELGIKNNNLYIFQVRPITKKILKNYYILDNSNIGENFSGETTLLTASFVKRLYSKVYKSVAYNSRVSYEKIGKLEHIFDDLIVYKNKALYYNIISWYKFLLLFPLDNKKAFDEMIGTKINLKYLYIDDVYKYMPSFLFKIKYFFILIYKIITFDYKIKKLDNYLKKFYKDFKKINLETLNLNELYLLYKEFEQNLSYLWYITIDNDFVIMKLAKNIDLASINGLISANQLFFLKEVSMGKKTKKEYLETYGHRFGDELKLEVGDIGENLEEFENLIKKYKNIKLEKKDSLLSGNKFLSKYIKNREKFRLYRSKNFSVARKIFLEIGKKFVEEKIIKKTDDIFDLDINYIFDKILSLNNVYEKGSEKLLIGKSFEGKVLVIDKFHIPKNTPEIIVSKNFDPGWIILLGGIKGIILENGNMLSHISIICRELNIPLLIGVKDATKIYKNGDRLKINSNGEILCKNT